MATRVAVQTHEGVVEAVADVSRPATDLHDQGAKLRAKFEALVEPVLGSGTQRLAESVSELQDIDDIGEVLTLTR